MKINKLIIPTVAGLLLAASAPAQDVILHVSGSTAFRSAVLNLLNGSTTNNPFDFSSISTKGDTNAGKGFPGCEYVGTMTNLGGAFAGGTPLKVGLTFNFTGSANGISDVVNARALKFFENNTGTFITNSIKPDLAFADNYSESCPTPISESTMDDSIVGVPVFSLIRTPDTFAGVTVSGINNLSLQQFQILVTDNGPSGMPDTFLGGTNGQPVYLIGRDQGSGTRITTDRNTFNTSGQNLWFFGTSTVNFANNGDTNPVTGTYAPAQVQTDGNTLGVGAGFLSGGDVGNTVSHSPSSFGYVGLADLKGSQLITFDGAGTNGVDVSGSLTAPLARAAEAGTYPYWSYEHLYNVKNGLTANQVAVRDYVIGKIKNVDFQNSSVYANVFSRLASMGVDRGGDGGTITRGSAAGTKF